MQGATDTGLLDFISEQSHDYGNLLEKCWYLSSNLDLLALKLIRLVFTKGSCANRSIPTCGVSTASNSSTHDQDENLSVVVPSAKVRRISTKNSTGPGYKHQGKNPGKWGNSSNYARRVRLNAIVALLETDYLTN